MTLIVGQLKAILTADVVDLKKGLAEAQKSLGGFSNAIASLGFGAATLKMAQLADQFDGLSGEIKRTFTQNGESIDRFVRDSVDSLGFGQAELAKTAISFGGIFKSFGFDDADTARLSEQFVKLSADIARSFDGTTIEEASARITAGLRGSEKALSEYGITVGEQALQQTALSLGLSSTISELSAQEKALVTLTAIQSQSAKFSGEAAKGLQTLGGATDRLKGLTGQLAAQMGEALAPALIKVAEFASNVVKILSSLPNPMLAAIGGFTALAAAMLSVNAAAGALGVTFGALMTPIAASVATFAAVYSAFVGIRSLITGDSFVNPIKAIADAFDDIATGATSALTTIRNFIRGFIVGLGELVSFIPGVGGALDKLKAKYANDAGADGATDFIRNQGKLKTALDQTKIAVDDNSISLSISADEVDKYKARAEKAAAATAAFADAQKSLQKSFNIAQIESALGPVTAQIESALDAAKSEIEELNKLARGKGLSGISGDDKSKIAFKLKVELEKLLVSNATAENFAELIGQAGLALSELSDATIDATKAIEVRGKSDAEKQAIVDAKKAEITAQREAVAAAKVTEAFEKVNAAAQELANMFSSAASSLLSTAGGVLSQDLRDGRRVSLQAGAVGATVGGATGAAAGAALGIPPQQAGQVGSFIGGFIGATAEASGALDGLGDEVGKSVRALQKGFGAVVSSVAPLLTLYAKTFGKVLIAVGDGLSSIAPVAKSFVTSMMPMINLLMTTHPILIGLNQVMSDLAMKAALVSGTVSLFGYGINTVLAGITRALASFLRSVGLKDQAASLTKTANDFAKAARDSLRSANESFLLAAKIGAGIVDQMSISGGGKDAIRAAQEAARQAQRDELKARVKEMMDNKIAASAGKLADEFQKLSDSVSNATSDFKASAYRFDAAGGLSSSPMTAFGMGNSFGINTSAASQIIIENLYLQSQDIDSLSRDLQQRSKRENFTSTGSTRGQQSNYYGRGESI